MKIKPKQSGPGRSSEQKFEVSSDTPVPQRSLFQRIGAILLIIVLLAGGVFIARYLLKTKPEARKKPPRKIQTLVKVKELHQEDIGLVIEAMGTVIPARRLWLNPEVSGTVVSVSESLTPGGLVKKGDVLIELDKRDSEFALIRARNNLKKAEMDLKLEKGNQEVARQAWQMAGEVTGRSPAAARSELALRGPQLAKIEAGVASARAEVGKAELDLARTRINAPFNGIVMSRDVDVGSRVSSQTRIAELVGTDIFWVRLTLKRDALQWIFLPGPDGKGSSEITLGDIPTGDQGQRRPARLLRLLGNLEPNGLMARVLVAVDDPLSLSSSDHPLLLGSFVMATIRGKTLSGVFRVPRISLLPGNRVLLAADGNTLTIREVTPIWKDRDWIYVSKGLSEGERLVVSPVAAPVEGMELRVSGERGRKDERRTSNVQRRASN